MPDLADPVAAPCILVVEDSALTRRFLVIALQAEGYRVATASHGQEALDQLEAGFTPDLIVLDREMPVMDGARFRREQLRSARYAAIPVLHLSGTRMRDEDDLFAGCGIATKPLTASGLAALVRELLNR